MIAAAAEKAMAKEIYRQTRELYLQLI